jgi:hypothetical protein
MISATEIQDNAILAAIGFVGSVAAGIAISSITGKADSTGYGIRKDAKLGAIRFGIIIAVIL